jgi:hypothetical protein
MGVAVGFGGGGNELPHPVPPALRSSESRRGSNLPGSVWHEEGFLGIAHLLFHSLAAPSIANPRALVVLTVAN